MDLESIPWAGKAGAGRRYRSEHFVLDSDAPEGVVRRAAGRLEQVYAAYSWYLPPRTTKRRPTTIELFQSQTGYKNCLRAAKLDFVNIGCYDPTGNRILCFSDLERLGDEMETVRQQHQQIRADLDKQEKDLRHLYHGAELGRKLTPIRDTRAKLVAADRQNEGLFDQATQQLFAVLGHEAFHAYLANAVYPPPAPEPPRWLNEGLAQIFESAVVEAGELRVGRADRDRLARIKEAVRKGELTPLARLLRSKPRDFLAAHSADHASTDMNYLTAWGLAFHLAFQRHLLGTPALDHYFEALAHGADPEAAFAKLVDQPVDAFETAFRQYLLQLQADGTVTPGPRPEK